MIHASSGTESRKISGFVIATPQRIGRGQSICECLMARFSRFSNPHSEWQLIISDRLDFHVTDTFFESLLSFIT
jgi:hypothetical protein